jgi:hypothetical protein
MQVVDAGPLHRSSVPILTHLAGVSTPQAKFAVYEKRSPTEIVAVPRNGYPTDVSHDQPNYVRNGAILILQEDPKKSRSCSRTRAWTCSCEHSATCGT